ncbi:MAG: dATP/dGTP diphosphohydrolase domain-containing protein, partial [Geminicoccaceae bacterium]
MTGERKSTNPGLNPKDAVGAGKAPISVLSGPVLAEVGIGLLEGALKYGRHNYRVAGVRASVYHDATFRHLIDWWEGEDIDPDSDLNHVTKAICSLVVLRDAMIRDLMIDDRPPKSPKGWLAKLNARARALVEKYPNPKPAFLEGDQHAPQMVLGLTVPISKCRIKICGDE